MIFDIREADFDSPHKGAGGAAFGLLEFTKVFQGAGAAPELKSSIQIGDSNGAL